jgi:hypothetical protein
MTHRRGLFPRDLLALLLQPVLTVATALLLPFCFGVAQTIRHPVVSPTAFHVATTGAIFGAVLLLFAKLPQYRAGVFFRVGYRHLPRHCQGRYQLAFIVIVPSILTMIVLVWFAVRAG